MFIGVRWCSLVFVGVCWCLLVFVGVRWCLLVFVGVRWCSLVSVGVCLFLLDEGGKRREWKEAYCGAKPNVEGLCKPAPRPYITPMSLTFGGTLG